MLRNILLSAFAVMSLKISHVHAGKPGEDDTSSDYGLSRKRTRNINSAVSSDQFSDMTAFQTVDQEGCSAYLASLDYLISLAPDDNNHEFDYVQSPVVEGPEVADIEYPTPVEFSESIETDVETEENNHLGYLKPLDHEETSYPEYEESLDHELESFYYFDRYNSDYGYPVELDDYVERTKRRRRIIDSYQHMGSKTEVNTGNT